MVSSLKSSRIFIAMLHLYGTRGDTKIWAKIISAYANKCSRTEVSVAEWRWVGQKGGSVATCRGMHAKQGDYKCGDRINTLLDTHGCYDGLWRKSVLIYASRVALSAQSYQ